ncbi:hypothetical protein [Neisseria weixii]|uniref:hypothetical protein n=1 Tax=Neisseria weixii TaxID=1853276 RepID=UPI00359F32CE
MSIKKPAVRENGNNQAAAQAAVAKRSTEGWGFMMRRYIRMVQTALLSHIAGLLHRFTTVF